MPKLCGLQILPHSWRFHVSQAPSAKHGIVVGAEVAKALREGAPVVALESTIISHGMPYPQNLATAQEVEAIVRQGAPQPHCGRAVYQTCCDQAALQASAVPP